MSLVMWGVAGIVGLCLFGMGLLVGWIWFGPESKSVNWIERRINSIMSVGFACIGLTIFINVVVLTHNFAEQVHCNAEMSQMLAENAAARQKVLEAAIPFDIALTQYLQTEREHGGVVPPTAPAVKTLLDRNTDLQKAREEALRISLDNRFVKCGSIDPSSTSME